MYKLPLDVSRCFDASHCEMKNVCLRNDENGRVYSYFRKEGLCNKENNYKMLKSENKEFYEVKYEGDKKT